MRTLKLFRWWKLSLKIRMCYVKCESQVHVDFASPPKMQHTIQCKKTKRHQIIVSNELSSYLRKMTSRIPSRIKHDTDNAQKLLIFPHKSQGLGRWSSEPLTKTLQNWLFNCENPDINSSERKKLSRRPTNLRTHTNTHKIKGSKEKKRGSSERERQNSLYRHCEHKLLIYAGARVHPIPGR